ncbi:acyltransferase GLAUCE-like [Nymphaea colorata]|nr:acyltransferase GLAUCE-like [Nymphaea colorata]
MEVVEVETSVVVPAEPTKRGRLFLSNIDLTLVAYHESVAFFLPKPVPDPFPEVEKTLKTALTRLLVHYDFMAGRLAPTPAGVLEIDCNDAGVVVATATASCSLEWLGELMMPKPEYKELVKHLVGHLNKKNMEDKPLLLLQLTRFQCGGHALACLCNHCTLDGIGIRTFCANLAACTLGKDLLVPPNPDRTIFKARVPPKISYPHHEYSKLSPQELSPFSIPGECHADLFMHDGAILTPSSVFIPQSKIDAMKSQVLAAGKLKKVTDFHVVAAKVWKERSLAIGMPDDCTSTMLFPVDVRRHMSPKLGPGFAGNALVPGFACATVLELKSQGLSFCVEKVQEGLERLDEEYIRSGIDWLEVNRGAPRVVDSFSVVAWTKIGFGEEDFWWGKAECLVPVELKPGLVMLLPGDEGSLGINVCLALPNEQMKAFCQLMVLE